MRLQPDIIKLDRALTTGVDADPAKAPLISSFVRYARDIDADVCAEGVETLAELERLADLDVAYGQGYGIARPAAPWVAGRRRRPPRPACTPSRRRLADAARRRRHRPRPPAGAARAAARGGHHPRRSSRRAWCRWPPSCRPTRSASPVDAPRPRTQLLADDPVADPGAANALRAAGFGSRLTLPIIHGGETVGHLEAYAPRAAPVEPLPDRPRAVICYQLGALLHGFTAAAASS